MNFKDAIKCKTEKTEKEKIVEAYIEYISSQGENFLEFVETLNECIGIAEKYELIGDVNIKARIKDFDSSSRNTEKKAVDDTFGVEIITTTERDKEWIMLLTELVFRIGKNKGFRIEDNGYVAYNQMVSLRDDRADYDFYNITEIIKNARMQEKRSHSSRKTVTVDKYPILKGQLQNGVNLEFNDLEKRALLEIVQKLDSFRSKIKIFKTCSYMPLIEMQMKTSAVADDAIRGAARHDKYKIGKKEGKTQEEIQLEIKENQERIKRLYESGYIKRGINVPIKFERVLTGNGKKIITIQDVEQTFLEMYYYLRTNIVEGRTSTDKEKSREYEKKIRAYRKQDRELLTIFPFLRKYIQVREENLTDEAKTNLILAMMNTDISNADCINCKTIRRIIICKNQNY